MRITLAIMLLARAAAAAGHMYLFEQPDRKTRVLFMLPIDAKAERGVCAVASLTYGPPDGRWQKGTGPAERRASCEFRQIVHPGPLVPYWLDEGPEGSAAGGEYEVDFALQTASRESPAQKVTLRSERVQPPAGGGAFDGKAEKAGGGVRVEITNRNAQPVLVGDSVAARNKPQDSCVGSGPAALLQPGESLVDRRPGILSKSMQIWVALFDGMERCKWVEVPRRKR